MEAAGKRVLTWIEHAWHSRHLETIAGIQGDGQRHARARLRRDGLVDGEALEIDGQLRRGAAQPRGQRLPCAHKVRGRLHSSVRAA